MTETYTDEHGNEWKKYSFDYSMYGKPFSFNAWARSREEARTTLTESLRNAEFHHGPD